MKGSSKKLPSLSPQEKQAIEEFFVSKNLPLDIAITFDDVFIPEEYSPIRSREEAVHSFLSGGLRSDVVPGFSIALPIVSANMESVTGVKMITKLQQLGGLGIPPQMLPAEERLKMLDQVAQEDCAFRENPLTVRPYQTLREVREIAKTHDIYGFFVVNEKKQPVGVLSSRDWLYETDETKQVQEMMGGGRIRPLITATKDIPLAEAARILAEHRIEKLPLVDSDGKLAGALFANGLFYKMRYPNATRNNLGQFVRVASIGVGRNFTNDHLNFIEEALKRGAQILLIDTARAWAVNMQDALMKIKREFPNLPVIAGNISTANGAKALLEWGADCVKIGQGPGYACRTREIGTGTPQLTAIAECSVICHLYGKKAMADGGMRSPGDIAKALLAGADTVMLGYMLVGTVESAAEQYYNRDGCKVKDYEGSASFRAQLRRHARGELANIRRPEGIHEQVHVHGNVREIIYDILWGLASLFTYEGSLTLEEFKSNRRFRRQSKAGFIEGVKR
jgi:IMP dehydrogenase